MKFELFLKDYWYSCNIFEFLR